MNTKLLTVALAATTLVACAETTPTVEEPLDPEHGLETLDGKDDSFAVRDGSPEGDAVLAYVNRDIADNAAGVVFLDDIDTRLHAWAARNIAEFRSGPDGDFGTADDRKFENLAELDRVPWVGRSALMELFGLAEAAGLFQRPTVDCAEYVEHDRWNNYYIDSYADLLEVENSRCSTINGNVYLQISGTDLLPPQARAIKNLRYLKTINGQLQITTSNHWTSVHFDALETVTGDLTASSPSGRLHTLEFKSLKSAKSITLQQIGSSLFQSLEQNDNIRLTNTDLEGFTALKTAARLTIDQDHDGTFNIAFPALTNVNTLIFDVQRRNSWTPPNIAFTGGFAKLASVGSLQKTNGKYGQLTYPALEEVSSLHTSQTEDPHSGMTALTNVNNLTSSNDLMAGGVHAGPEALEAVGTLNVTTELDVDGYDVLETASGNIAITTNKGVQGFDDLQTVGGSINLTVGRVREAIELNGFNDLTDAGSITITANNAPATVGPMFEALEFTGGLSLVSNGGFDKNLEFPSLAGVEGHIRIDHLSEGVEVMPELQLVDGGVTINRTPAELKGFPILERIEGSLTLKANVNTISGLNDLVAIGGNLGVPRTLGQPALDNFLLQLEEFSGSINYN